MKASSNNVQRSGRKKAIGVIALLLSFYAFGQQLQVPSLPSAIPTSSSPLTSNSPVTTSTDDDDRDRAKSGNDAMRPSQDPTGVLTASQITTIVQTRPELVVDLKQVMSDYLQQQGTSIQADSISDDMLYKGIAADPGLRSAISVWLRARGYVSDSDFDRSDSDSRGVDDDVRGSDFVTNSSRIGNATLIDPNKMDVSSLDS